MKKLKNKEILPFNEVSEFDTDDGTYIDIMSEFIKELSKYPVYTKEEEIIAFSEYKNEIDPELKLKYRNEFLNHNMRLITKIATKYASMTTHLQLLDLIGLGYEGAIRAIEKFEPDKGFKFSTYATWWIKQSIMRGIANYEHEIRIPAHQYEMVLKFNRIKAEYYNKKGKQPDDKYLMKELKLKKQEYSDLLVVADYLQLVSLNIQVCESEHNEDTELMDMISDTSIEMPEDVVMRHELEDVIQKYLHQYLETIPNIDRRKKIEQLIIHRYGLNGVEVWTLEQAGQTMGVTRERARQIQNKFLKWMSHPVRKNKLKYFL